MSTTKRTPNRQQQNNNNASSDMGSTALVAGSALLSNAGGITVTSCTAEDNSFYCQFVKGFNVFKMLLFILAILIGGYFLYTMYVSSNSNRTR